MTTIDSILVLSLKGFNKHVQGNPQHEEYLLNSLVGYTMRRTVGKTMNIINTEAPTKSDQQSPFLDMVIKKPNTRTWG